MMIYIGCDTVVGSLERLFRQAIRYNAEDIGNDLLCPICRSMLNADSELQALRELFKELKRLEKNPLRLGIPPNQRKFGIFLMRINVAAYKTHSRTVNFLPNDKGAETSDIVVLVTHEFLDSSATTLVDEKISFFQAKIEGRKGGFKITPRQWHLMRYWPKFSYGGTTFDLVSCKKVPDVCSFYLFLFRDKRFSDSIFGTQVRIKTPYSNKHSKCTINSVCMSTPWMERLEPSLKNLTQKDLLLDKAIDLSFNEMEQTDRFFSLFWFLLSTHLGAHDPRGVDLMKKMFPQAFNESDPPSDKEDEEKPSIGVKINVQLRTEHEYMKR